MTYYIPRAELDEIASVFKKVQSGSGKGVEKYYFYHEEGVDEEDMCLGWSMYADHKKKSIAVYEKVRRKPGVKTTYVNCIGIVADCKGDFEAEVFFGHTPRRRAISPVGTSGRHESRRKGDMTEDRKVPE